MALAQNEGQQEQRKAEQRLQVEMPKTLEPLAFEAPGKAFAVRCELPMKYIRDVAVTVHSGCILHGRLPEQILRCAVNPLVQTVRYHQRLARAPPVVGRTPRCQRRHNSA